MPATQGIHISWHGVPQVTKSLLYAAKTYRNPGHVNKIIRPAARKMQQEIKNVTQSTFMNAPHSTGNLARSIKLWTYRRFRGVLAGAHYGKASGPEKESRYPDGYYFGFHERGTKKGIKAKYMMQRAYQAKGQQVASEIANALIADLKYFL